jgi:hypothetical protein
MYPLVYNLLPAKSQIIYTKLLTLLKDLCQQHQLKLPPRTIFLDYEVAIRNAAHAVFPDIKAKGCFFHYTQCIWRKMEDTDLQVPYKENNDINKLVRSPPTTTCQWPRRCMVLCAWRSWRSRYQHSNTSIHRLHHLLLGWKQQASMEPLPNRRSKNYQPLGRLAQ